MAALGFLQRGALSVPEQMARTIRSMPSVPSRQPQKRRDDPLGSSLALRSNKNLAFRGNKNSFAELISFVPIYRSNKL
jgi:hypothetical protein